jgi:hypothetical protein
MNKLSQKPRAPSFSALARSWKQILGFLLKFFLIKMGSEKSFSEG